MRATLVGVMLTLAWLVPRIGNAQAYPFYGIASPLQTRPPQVTAATADWQISNAPIIAQQLVYYPTNQLRPFDGNVMMQIGAYQGVPIYADATLEPFSVIYVPVARGNMRMYERRRDGELAGTTGSRTPTYPVAPITAGPIEERPVGTGGAYVPPTAATIGTLPERMTSARPTRTRIESIPGPRATDGVWIQFDGAKWYSDGSAATFSADRFAQIGEYRGFPVYREKSGKKNEIWVAVVKDGPVAPYTRR
jgi:hypothetical protein